MTNEERLVVNTEVVTPEKAGRWLQRNIKRNRFVSPGRVRDLARQISSGRWQLTGDPIRFDSKGELIDGQHRLHAIIQAGRRIRTLVVYGLDAEKVTPVIDSGRPRSHADKIVIMTDGSVKPRVAGIFASAAKYRFRETGLGILSTRVSPSTQEILDILSTEPDLMDSSVWAEKKDGLLIVPGVSAYCHYRFGLEDSTKTTRDSFFESFHLGTNLRYRNPVLALRARLIREKAILGRKLKKEHQLLMLIRAWNAVVEGRQLSKIQIPLRLKSEFFSSISSVD